jgi:phage terminase large subunit-like protein
VSLDLLAKRLDLLTRKAKANPLEWMKWTPPQLEWLQSSEKASLLRGGNQVGKTYAQCAELIWRCLGTHPFKKTHTPPIEAWLICHSMEQSIAVQTKLWSLLPKDEVHPSTVFIPGRGIMGRVPLVRFLNGSIIRIKTSSQGSLGASAATLHYVGIDEPPPPDLWGELQARVLRKRGQIGLTLTPVGRPVGWLKALVEEGTVRDIQAPLTLENVTPAGGRPLLSQEEIDEISKSYLPIDRPQRLLGEWEGTTMDRLFTGYGEHCLTDAGLPEDRDWKIGIGIDHGSRPGKQVAILTAVDPTGAHPEIWVLDEYVASLGTPDDHAHAIIRMLDRNGMTWHNVDRWTGDIPHRGTSKGAGRMSNRLLSRGFEHALSMEYGRCPFKIKPAWKPRWSVYWGCQVLNEAMERKLFFIRPRCQRLLQSLANWTFRDDDLKDPVDALRYSAVSLLPRSRPNSSPSQLRIY